MTSLYNSEAISELEAHFIGRSDKLNRWGNIVASYQALPGLVGFWPFSSVQRSTGNAYDLSGQGRTLTYNGNPIYAVFNDFAPFIRFDGTGDYLSRSDETDLDILGTETIFAPAARGLTFGGWFRTADITPAANSELIGKRGASGQFSYWLRLATAGNVTFFLSGDGTNNSTVAISTGLTDNTWFFAAGRFDPSTELKIWLNINTNNNTTSIPASVFNSTADFVIGGASGGASLFTGDAALCFLCANMLPDGIVNGLFQQSRVLFGV